MLTAIPVEINKYHCIDSVFLTVAHYFKREIGLMSVGSWGFDYQPNLTGTGIFGEKLFSGMVMPSRETVRRYHGIYVDWRENVTWEELTEAIRVHVKENRPLGIFINGYHCPWNPVYHHVKVDHYCIVIGYDSQAKNYYCIDSYFSQASKHPDGTSLPPKVCLLPETDLKQGFREYISFTLEKPVTQYSLAQVFRDVQLGPEDFLKRRHTFENMTQFGRDLAQNLDIDLEMADCNGQVEAAKLYRQFIQYSQRRQNFADALRFLKNRADDVTVEMAEELETASEEFNKVAAQWNKMGLLMIKLSLTKKETIREKMGALMEQIGGEELALLRNVIDIGRMAICS